MSDLDFDLDSILAEFSDEAEPSPAPQPPQKPRPPKAEARPRHAAAEPALEKTAEKPPKEKKAPRRPQEAETPSAVPEEPTRLHSAASERRPLRRSAAKTAPREKPARRPRLPRLPRREKRTDATQPRVTRRSLTALGLLLTAIALGWLLLNVHPGSSAANPVQQEDLSGRVSSFLDTHRSRTLGGPEAARAFVLSETAQAPAPDPSCYGSTGDIAQVQALIDRAALLLDGQSLAWDPQASFMPDSPFQYYLDDSIFVLCWKEIIDGKCCSCAEVKIADGSQLRRKLAEDSYGSGVQLYATQLAREANAVVAINGDFYAFRNLGITVYQGQLYRCGMNAVDSCFFTRDGDMLFAYADQFKSEDEVRSFIEEQDVRFSLAFGPVLVDDGQLCSVTSYPVGEIDHYYSRSSIGQLGKLHYLLMTVNYEGPYQHTCTTMQSGRYMLQKGCQKAYSLDGGQTSIIVLDGKAFNRVDWNNERSMSDIVYFASALRREGA